MIKVRVAIEPEALTEWREQMVGVHAEGRVVLLAYLRAVQLQRAVLFGVIPEDPLTKRILNWRKPLTRRGIPTGYVPGVGNPNAFVAATVAECPIEKLILHLEQHDPHLLTQPQPWLAPGKTADE